MNLTPIEWTTFSANPLKFRTPDGRVVWACEKLSDGCKFCYAEDLSHRYGGTRRAGDWNAATMATLTPFLDEAELRKMLTAKTIGGQAVSGSKCFIGDMTDIFGEWVPDALLDQLFAVFALRPDVIMQILTKRAERARDYLLSRSKSAQRWKDAARSLGYALEFEGISLVKFPLPNVHVGISAENQRFADERIPLLLQTPAAVRFISAEPLLGPIDLRSLRNGVTTTDAVTGGETVGRVGLIGHRLDWVIVGGESGPRPMHPDWARSLRDQCAAAGVAFFYKQQGSWLPFYDRDKDDPDWGNVPKETPTVKRLNLAGGCGFHGERVIYLRKASKAMTGRLLDGREHNEFPKRRLAQ